MNAMVKFALAKQATKRKKGNSVASVFVRGGMLYVRKKIAGKLYPYSTGKKNTDVNKQWVEYHSESIWEEKHTKKNEESQASSEPTLKEFGLKYFSICPETRENDTNDKLLNDFEEYVIPLLGEYQLSAITSSMISEWQQRIKYYPDEIPEPSKIDSVKPKKGHSRISNIRNTITLVYNQAILDRVVNYSPVTNVKLAKKVVKRRTLSIKEAEMLNDDELEDVFVSSTVTYTEEEIQRLIRFCDKKIQTIKASHNRFTWMSFRWMMIFKFYSGIRSGETIALMWSNIHFDTNKIDIRFTMKAGGELKLPKENKTRTINMLPEARQALLELKKLSGHTKWVFLSARREPYKNVDGANKLWKQLVKMAKLKPARFYNTRHSFVTNMFSRGMNPEWLIQQVGHENIVITRQHYEGNIEPEWDKLNSSGISLGISVANNYLESA